MKFARYALIGLVLITSGCLSPHSQEKIVDDYDLYSDAENHFTISQHIRGTIYRLPLADTTSPSFTSNEIEIRYSSPAPESRVSCDLQKHPKATLHQAANFIGATGSYGFWAYESGYFVVDLKTAHISFVECNRDFVMYGTWSRLSPTAIHRKSFGREFDLSIDGAHETGQVDPAPQKEPNQASEPTRSARGSP